MLYIIYINITKKGKEEKKHIYLCFSTETLRRFEQDFPTKSLLPSSCLEAKNNFSQTTGVSEPFAAGFFLQKNQKRIAFLSS